MINLHYLMYEPMHFKLASYSKAKMVSIIRREPKVHSYVKV